MATLLLQAAGSLVGGVLGGPFGALIGRALGGAVGASVDGALLTAITGPKRLEGPRLSGVPATSAEQGQPIPKLYCRARLGGQIIWMTRFVETAKKTRSSGKFGVTTAETTEYSYAANVAYGLCEGPIALVRRVWADGKELDLSGIALRVYQGSETQTADPLIVAKEGAANAPAYRGLAYVVLENFPIGRFGNRLPQMSFEVVRPVSALSGMIKAVNLIPGTTEFGYDTEPVVKLLGEGENANENRRQLTAATDFLASIDALEALCPNLTSINLVLGWFGTDLRAGTCLIRPGVEEAVKDTQGAVWAAGGVSRAAAHLVSRTGGRAAYGGTPSDSSVVRAITELKARGFKVTLYPFVMMDVPAGNSLPDPWTGAGSQPAYPWRGRITCHPAPGASGSVDGTAAAATQVAALFGAATAAQFNVSGGTVTYSGNVAEWSLRRHILHCAALGKAAGGVDAVIIGSEMVGLTRVRDASGNYPAVTQLRGLLSEVRALMGSSTKLVYAADWTEYGAHMRNGGADISFPLDPLWADAELDAIGIDFYPPISDWRDGTAHLDRSLAALPHDRAYLMNALAAGEAFDWYYANDAARAAQTRLPISDGAYGKPWTFRAKDLVGWWSNQHRPRMGGVEVAPTAFVPQGKPIWLTEIGCGAVDKGANQPNLFPDPKSSESNYPYASRRHRDDLMQANALEAILTRFDPAAEGHPVGANPLSSVYGGRMIDPDQIAIWAYDARPFPAFPSFGNVWGDAANWMTGHWLNGRIEGAALEHVIRRLAQDFELPAPTFRNMEGFVEGYVVDRPMSARAALQPLLQLFGIDAVPEGAAMRFQGRAGSAVASLDATDFVSAERKPGLTRRRADEHSLPEELTVSFADGLADYRQTAISGKRAGTPSDRQLDIAMPAVLDPGSVKRSAARLLSEAWQARESLEAVLPPSRTALEPGDLIDVSFEGKTRRFRIGRLSGGLKRALEAVSVDETMQDADLTDQALPVRPEPPAIGPASARVFELPVPVSGLVPLNRIGVKARPWNGPMTLWRSQGGGSFTAAAEIAAPAQIGTLLTALPPGPVWRWDKLTSVDVEIKGTTLAAIPDIAALAGGNLLAVGPEGGPFEIISAALVTLIGPDQFRLTRLLRGLYGTEQRSALSLAVGALCFVVNDQLQALETSLSSVDDSISYRLSSRGRDFADPMATAFSATPSLAALLPYAPVHPLARRGSSGVTISFKRRTREDGDNWALAEVPLGEAAESYLVEILSGVAVKRSVTVPQPQYLYTSAQEIADFGSAQASLKLRIRQISLVAGPGLALERTIPVN